MQVIRQSRMDGKWMECGCIMGGIWVEYQLYGWGMGGLWIKYGWSMGGIWVILVAYGWNGVDGMISVVKNGKFEIF